MGSDWRGTGSSISELLSSLHKEPSSVRDSFTDVTIILPDKTQVRAHKFVLMLASPRFEAHFSGLWSDNDGTFAVSDVSSQTFRNFLDFIYNSGKVENLDISDYWSLLEAGHLYIHKGLIKHCTKKLSKHIRKLDASEEMADFINKAINLSIYDELVDVATKTILQKFPHFFQEGLLNNLNQKSLNKIKAGLATSSWVGEAGNCLYIQNSLVWKYDMAEYFGDVINQCKRKILIYLKSKEDFIQRVKFYLDDALDDEVMEKLNAHMESQSWEELLDEGNAFINIIKFLMDQDIYLEPDNNFNLMELENEDALDWNDWHADNTRFKDEISWWNLLIYSRSAHLTNLKEYCKNKLIICNIEGKLNKDNLIFHMNRSSEFAEDKDLFKLVLIIFLMGYSLSIPGWRGVFRKKENWVTLNENAIIGIRDNSKEFSQCQIDIKKEEFMENVQYWCKENSRTESEAKERFLNIMGTGFI